jgi:hypothetical protein
MNFKLDDSFAWDISIREEWSIHDNKPNLTPKELLEVIKGVGKSASISNDDHPDFKALRNQLEELGYIECERGWWNGDRVLKPFTLNDVAFEVHEKFPCGAAMQSHLRIQRKYEHCDK